MMARELTLLGLKALQAGLASGDFTARELVQAYFEAIGRADKLNIYLNVPEDQAFQAADASDMRRRSGEALALDGVPVAVKDLFCCEGVPTTAGSRMLESFIPPYESTVTAKLWQAGAVMLGKVNCDEFAMGSSNETSYFGPVVSPWRKRGASDALVPGGSSGGSAAAVSAHLAPLALGTDTGGSIRQPAAFTGTVGIKPTYGRCSRWGIAAFASSLDQAGVFTRSVEDAALALEVISGHDERDSTSAQESVPHFSAACDKSPKGLKIGIPKEYRLDGMSESIEALWHQGIEWYREAGAEIVDISLPHTRYALPAYYVIAPAEASSNLARYDGARYGFRADGPFDSLADMYAKTRAQGFGDEVRRRLLIGTYVLSAGYYDAYYLKAQKVRGLIRRDFDQAFEKVDAILTPTTPSAAFGLGAKGDQDPIAMYLNDVFTVTVNLAGLPGISVPAGLSHEGLPLGLQLIGRAFDESTLFTAGRVIERAAPAMPWPEPWWGVEV